MTAQTTPNTILPSDQLDLSSLPGAEDDRHEYKSSKSTDTGLKEKIPVAASAFWNSGGGLLVLGVDSTGRPDGGITLMVGHQSRRDWIDQEVARVTPSAPYTIETVQQSTDQCSIKAGHAVFLIRFSESVYAPHMAPDNRYYIRAGAHTVSARHFIVEALHARRGLRAPMLRHVVRRKPVTPMIVQLGIVNLTASPALEVTINLSPLPPLIQSFRRKPFPLFVPVVNEQIPLFFDCHFLGHAFPPPFTMTVCFFDTSGNTYNETFKVDVEQQLGPDFRPESETAQIVKQLNEITRAVKDVSGSIKSKH